MEQNGAPGDVLRDTYDRLLARFGRQSWWPGDSPFEIIIGAILGAGVGAIAGAFIPRTTTVYRAAGRQAPHVDLTGEWSLDTSATRLQLANVATLERGTLTIVQSRSTLRFKRVFAMRGAENTFSFELPLDGTEAVTQADGETRYSRLYWEAGDLVYATRIVAAAGESTNVVHYRLSADRNTLEAHERRRGVDNYDNVWVFRRSSR